MSAAPEPRNTNTGETLHALSWLFVLIAQLLNLIGPILLVLVAGRMRKDDGWQAMVALIAALVLSAYSLFYTRTFRFWVTADELIIKEGLFNRTLRHVPFARIQNVAFRQTLLHRIFGVVELNLESGAGTKPEAKMTVLPLLRARLLQQQIRGAVVQMPLDDPAQPSAAISPTEVLVHQVSTAELLRLGLISNRGMVLVGSAFYFLSQSNLIPSGRDARGHSLFNTISHWLRDSVGVAHGPLFWAAMIALWFVMIVLVVRVASMLLAVITFHDFKLYVTSAPVSAFGHGQQLRVEHGLSTRQGGSTSAHRIVCLLLRDGLLYRWFKRQSVAVVLPGNSHDDGSKNARGMRYLSPISRPDVANDLIELASGISFKQLVLNPLHVRAWRRMVKWPLLIVGVQVLALIVFLAMHQHVSAALMMLCFYVGFSFWMVRCYQRSAAVSGYQLTPTHCIIRAGYFSQCTHILPRREVQSVTLSQSPFDRRSHMATVAIDLCAGSAFETPHAAVHYLAIKDARKLAASLRLKTF